MFETISRWTWVEWIGNMSSIIGIVGAFFTFLVWFKLRKQQKTLIQIAKHAPQIENFKELIDYHATVKTINPYAFAVCLLPHSGSIAKEVSAFLSSKGTKMPIEELNFDGLRQHNLEDFINQLRIKRREFETKEATEIHLFIAGPIMSGVLIGAEFDNWKPVKLYHQNRDTKQYEFWCPLTK